jgi:hypothetical protein
MIAFIESQGSLLSMRVTGFKASRTSFGGRRGIIRTFSRASRIRLMRFMARLKVRKIRATFITLTFSEMVSNERAKQVFKRFSMRLRRMFKSASAVWRMEYQTQRGAIHFHLICFNLPFWLQEELQRTWEACTEEHRSIVDIRLIHGARSIMAYVSKYIAKIDDREITSLDDGSYQHEPRNDVAGRFWGYINKELLPLGEVVSGVLTDRQTIKSISSLCWSILGSDNPYNSLSFHLFCDNARWLCERAIEEGGMFTEEWEYTLKDHTAPKQAYHPYTERFSETELALIPVRPTFGHARPNEVSEVQPCISKWVNKALRLVRFPEFA